MAHPYEAPLAKFGNVYILSCYRGGNTGVTGNCSLFMNSVEVFTGLTFKNKILNSTTRKYGDYVKILTFRFRRVTIPGTRNIGSSKRNLLK